VRLLLSPPSSIPLLFRPGPYFILLPYPPPPPFLSPSSSPFYSVPVLTSFFICSPLQTQRKILGCCSHLPSLICSAFFPFCLIPPTGQVLPVQLAYHFGGG
jgi:hypothetical protein